MRFSKLAVEFTGEQHPLYALLGRLKQQKQEVTDLVKGNVGEMGAVFPAELLDEILLSASRKASLYSPDPYGQPKARKAIVDFYAPLEFREEQILLSPGSSISYFYCFKVLADPGDEILCPQPSYPLLEYIAQLSDLRLRSYRLAEEQDWSIDFEDLESKINKRTKAIVLISPHNPSGAVLDDAEIRRLVELANKYHLPIISDEVFSEFVYDSNFSRPASFRPELLFTLNGLSKSFALPGMKISWIVVSGEEKACRQALGSLEMISDTFLPVNEIAQFALAEIFEKGKEFQRSYKNMLQECRQIAIQALDGLSFALPKGGFYLALKIEAEEETMALKLLEAERILVHPGYFYEMDGNHLIMTFIQERKRLEDAMQRLKKHLNSSA
ncbi:MAG: pyridoxal phosphate-dependent aminotransferase [Candidatus Obscuribacterales bacterium]|nr:pyridoxal phosphate-dependent aminotransferase [Candidatus Obscuribacterales bacterium]